MTDLLTTHYTLISFAYREGNVYRHSKYEWSVVRGVDMVNTVVRHVMEHAAKGEQVLVFEECSIKRDWSRVHSKAIHALATIYIDSFRRLMNGLNYRGGPASLSIDEFRLHVERTFYR